MPVFVVTSVFPPLHFFKKFGTSIPPSKFGSRHRVFTPAGTASPSTSPSAFLPEDTNPALSDFSNSRLDSVEFDHLGGASVRLRALELGGRAHLALLCQQSRRRPGSARGFERHRPDPANVRPMHILLVSALQQQPVSAEHCVQRPGPTLHGTLADGIPRHVAD